MNADIHRQYEKRLDIFATLLHGPHGLVAKLAIFDRLSSKFTELGEDLLKIDPLLFHFLKSMEIEVTLGTAKLIEGSKRSDGNIFKFLDFCASNTRSINWSDGKMTSESIAKQKANIVKHRDAINSVMGRRDKSIAHLDKKYLHAPDTLQDDFPLSVQDLIALTNELIMLVNEHERSLHPRHISFHLSEFFQMSVDNMIRNLHAGREKNFDVKLRLY
ncbi:hypothetical protein [Loktanella salsilacus]|uniref:AbiU2 domain-containing protein n=1 Tax=Loktanella salsilacus TaxID=195913 RepID=UPI00373574F1